MKYAARLGSSTNLHRGRQSPKSLIGCELVDFASVLPAILDRVLWPSSSVLLSALAPVTIADLRTDVVGALEGTCRERVPLRSTSESRGRDI